MLLLPNSLYSQQRLKSTWKRQVVSPGHLLSPTIKLKLGPHLVSVVAEELLVVPKCIIMLILLYIMSIRNKLLIPIRITTYFINLWPWISCAMSVQASNMLAFAFFSDLYVTVFRVIQSTWKGKPFKKKSSSIFWQVPFYIYKKLENGQKKG